MEVTLRLNLSLRETTIKNFEPKFRIAKKNNNNKKKTFGPLAVNVIETFIEMETYNLAKKNF